MWNPKHEIFIETLCETCQYAEPITEEMSKYRSYYKDGERCYVCHHDNTAKDLVVYPKEFCYWGALDETIVVPADAAHD